MRNLIILFFILFVCSVYSQTNVYEIVLFDNVIGEMQTNRIEVYGVETYSIKSEAETTVMFKDHSSSDDIKVVKKQGELETCSMIKTKNGDTDKFNILKQDESYKYTKNGGNRTLNGSIDYTTTEMFYIEPINRNQVFVERLGEWVQIKHLGNNQYQTKVDGSNNFYTYKDGKMVEMRIKNVVNIYMRLVES